MLDLSTTTSTVYLLNIILFKAFFFLANSDNLGNNSAN